MRSRIALVSLALIFALAAAAAAEEPAAQPAAAAPAAVAPKRAPLAASEPSSCMTCHSGLEGELSEPTKAWVSDVHAGAGLGCESCHGGDPSRAVATDSDAAMSVARGFTPAPDRLKVAEFCSRCHSDAAYMKKFNPQQRVDQYLEYRSSVHGKRNAKGDTATATCTDCHGIHGILPVNSPQSPVYATRVPQTCARCHSDKTRMAPYGIPTDQFDLFRASAHGAALLDRGDTAAPACNDCHGNHGAAPPGVQSVANVCGQCHGREASLFRASFKKELLESMGKSECTVCHDHHRIRHPTPDLFHGGSAPTVSAGRLVSALPFAAEFGDLSAGQKAEANWLVVLKPHVRADDDRLIHHLEIAFSGSEPIRIDATVRPGVPDQALTRTVSGENLSAVLGIEPMSGVPVEPGDSVRLHLSVEAGPSGAKGVTVQTMAGEAVIAHAGSVCLQCHALGDDCDKATEKIYGALTSLDRNLRDAATLLRRAEVAGMLVSDPLFELKSKGIPAAVEARALIHSFDPDRVMKRAGEGKDVAKASREAGLGALAELEFRRKGLAISLVLVGLVLVALFLKIRQLERERRSGLAAGSPAGGKGG